MNRIKRPFEGAKVRTWGQINPTTVLIWLATERERDAIGIKTSNYYLVAVKEFCNWAVDDGIVAENPLRSAKAMNAEGDVRRKRRAIGADEFQRLITAARMSGPVQGMDGQERAILYIVAAWTGFRRGELASLRLSQIVLDGDSPAITVSAAYSKRRREDSISLHPVVGYADFHANRHTFIANLVKVGIQPKLAQSLARHSDIRLTFNIYSHVEKGEQTEAIGKLHSPRLPQAGTGGKAIDSEMGLKPGRQSTDGEPSLIQETAHRRGSNAADSEPNRSQDANLFALQFAQTIRGGGHLEAEGGGETPKGVVHEQLPESPVKSGLNGDCQQMAEEKQSGQGRA